MKVRFTLIVAALLVGALSVSSCGGNPVPQLPSLVTASDKDVRASIAKAYDILGHFNMVLNDASLLEETAAKAAKIQDAPVRAQFVIVAKASKQLIADIDSGAVKDWTAIQARVNPLIAQLNSLLAMKPSGPSAWASIAEAAGNILIAILQPGFAQV